VRRRIYVSVVSDFSRSAARRRKKSAKPTKIKAGIKVSVAKAGKIGEEPLAMPLKTKVGKVREVPARL